MTKEAKQDSKEAQIRKRYDKGENLYEIARAVYDFDGDEQIDRIRKVLGYEEVPVNASLGEA